MEQLIILIKKIADLIRGRDVKPSQIQDQNEGQNIAKGEDVGNGQGRKLSPGRSKSKRKTIENTVILIIIGIIIIIAGSSLFKKAPSGKEALPGSENSVEVKEAAVSIKADEKTEIERILSQIDGAGSVSIMITYVSGNESVPAFNAKSTSEETNEKDNGGGTRVITQKDSEMAMAFEESSGIRRPVITKELAPLVRGVIVVADGAGDMAVKESLSKAVQVLLDIPIHKVQVYKRRR